MGLSNYLYVGLSYNWGNPISPFREIMSWVISLVISSY